MPYPLLLQIFLLPPPLPGTPTSAYIGVLEVVPQLTDVQLLKLVFLVFLYFDLQNRENKESICVFKFNIFFCNV